MQCFLSELFKNHYNDDFLDYYPRHFGTIEANESIVCKQIEAATNEVYTSSSIRETDQSFSKST